MSLKGMPDWSSPLKIGKSDLFFAFDDPLRALGLPIAMNLAEEPDGAPAIALEIIRLSDAADGPKSFALLTIRFTADYAIAERQQAVFSVYPDVRVESLAPRGGFLRFIAAGALVLPDDLLEPKPLVWAGVGSLTFAAQIGQSATRLFHDALLNGLMAVTAVAELETWGVASRVPAHVTFNPAVLVPIITDAAVDGKVSASALSAAFASTPGFNFEGIDTDAARIAAIDACVERLIGRYGKLAPANDPDSGTVYTFDTAAMTDGKIVWNLDEAVLVPRTITVASDPLETARQAITKGFSLSREAPIVPFATGLHVLSIFPNLPPKRIGVFMLGVEIRVPPFPPARPQKIAASALFREGETMKTANVRLLPQEPLAFEYQSIAYINSSAGVTLLTGMVQHHVGRHLTIAPDSFPVRFLRIDADATLLDATVLTIKCTGFQIGKPWSVEAKLDKVTSALAIAVPRDLEDGALDVTATTLDGGRTIQITGFPLEDCRFDMFSFPAAGPAIISVICEFDDDSRLAAIECVPEDRVESADAIGLVWLTPDNPRREWRWLVTNPLFDGFRWRWFRPEGAPTLPWSDRIDRASGPLVINSSQLTDLV